MIPFLLLSLAAHASIQPERIHTVDSKKNQAYIKDGLFVGGDRSIDEVMVTDIRRAAQKGFERLVIDLRGNRQGEPAAIPRPPYFQVSVSPGEGRLVTTIWGNPKLGIDGKKIQAEFKKSPNISSVQLLPRVEDDTWTFVMGLKPGRSVEVFELTNPVRIIVDIRTDRK